MAISGHSPGYAAITRAARGQRQGLRDGCSLPLLRAKIDLRRKLLQCAGLQDRQRHIECLRAILRGESTGIKRGYLDLRHIRARLQSVGVDTHRKRVAL